MTKPQMSGLPDISTADVDGHNESEKEDEKGTNMWTMHQFAFHL